MLRNIRVLIALGVMLVSLGGLNVLAQLPAGVEVGNNVRFNSGQNLQPIYDGWTHNPDGSFEMHFGYLNRNYVEELSIPVGANNSIMPGGPDRGQPAYFYPRFNRLAFSITVPANWGKQELVWTVNFRGITERAVAWLQPEWEIDPTPRGEANVPNVPPTLTITAPSQLPKPGPVTLAATITDDGQPPKPKPRANRSSENPPTFKWPQPTGTAPVNVPQVAPRPRLAIKGRMSLGWLVWRGPGPVTFDPPLAEADSGNVNVTATFSKPGEYVLRARASDPLAFTVRDVKITVGAP
jgi:hypothetical protein